jgi:hypothetical protein
MDEKERCLGASDQIDEMISGLDDWRGVLLAKLRTTINAAAPELSEGWKWGTPVWAAGKANVVGLAAFKQHVKINFFNGAQLDDPAGLFNAGLDAKTSRSIDVRQGEKLNDAALKRLIRAAAGQASARH